MNEPFTYKITKDNRVLIYRNNGLIKIIKGRLSLDFIESISRSDSELIQLKLAKITGNYKRGNEKK